MQLVLVLPPHAPNACPGGAADVSYRSTPCSTLVWAAGDNYVMGDIRQLPNMGVTEFSELNYTAKKAYNVKGLQLQLQSVYPTIGLSLLFNRSMIVSRPVPHFSWGITAT